MATPTPKRFRVVALVSGGKDGTLAAMTLAARAECEVVALANVRPYDDDAHELDSHCFQTVAHECVDALAACAGVDVFRRRMRGGSVTITRTYARSDVRDEVEDLRTLLRAVKRAKPETNAVCSGAILSDYQRLRVESVCADLGLTSLAPLWRVEQREILRRCAEEKVDARLVKTAAMGLDPRKHLGMSVVEATGDLIRAEDMYGSHCAGEGGEFETLVVDCPLFKRGRLELTETRTVTTSEDPFAPTAHLVVDKYDVVLKETPDGEVIPPGRVIWVNDDDCLDVEEEEKEQMQMDFIERDEHSEGRVVFESASCVVRYVTIERSSVANVSCSARPMAGRDATHETCAEAIFQCMGELVRSMPASTTFKKIAMTHVYLDDMSQFAKVNAVYAKYMPSIEPSARACVATCLSSGAKVQIDCVFVNAHMGPRKSLHVQSISSWAPACIGPYGQSISVDGLAYVAGQIGMEPTTLDLVPGIVPQLERAMRSAVAVAEITGAPLGARSLAVTLYTNAKYEDEYAAAGASAHPANVMFESFSREVDSSDRVFSWRPLVTQLVVTDLPKGAIGEIEPILLVDEGPVSHSSNTEDEDDVDVLRKESRAGASSILPDLSDVASSSVYRPRCFMRCTIVGYRDVAVTAVLDHVRERLHEAFLTPERLISCRLYHRAEDEDIARAVDDAVRTLVSGIDCAKPRCIIVPVVACGVDRDFGASFVLETYAQCP